MTIIRWGILGTGNIAKQFARGLAELDDAKLVAVGSRTAEGAAAFAQQFGSTEARHASADHEPVSHVFLLLSPRNVAVRRDSLMPLDALTKITSPSRRQSLRLARS